MPQSFSNTVGLGRSACALGAFVLLWNIAEWRSEESFVGVLSGCVIYRAHNSTIVAYSDGVQMVRCTATFIKNGAPEVIELISQLPRDFQIGTEPQKAGITVAGFGSKKARFSIFSRNWDDTLAKVLFLEFIGIFFIIKRPKK